MTNEEKIKYWLKTSHQDWTVSKHLFEKGDYTYALFFGHLTVEKVLKAIFVNQHKDTPPFSHNLIYLAEEAEIELSEEKIELLEEITDFNLEARYPDDKFSFFRKCTKEFAENKLNKIEEIREWLIQKLPLKI